MASEGFRLASSILDEWGELPIKFTVKEKVVVEKNISPPLEWYDVPQGTKSLALIVEDLNEAERWVHWLVVNIPPTLNGLPQGFSGKKEQMGREYVAVKEGINWRDPDMRVDHGRHLFQFRIFALDTDNIEIGDQVTKETLLDKIQKHVRGDAEFAAMTNPSPQE